MQRFVKKNIKKTDVKMLIALLSVLFYLFQASFSYASDKKHGLKIAEERCSSCHAIGKNGDSHNPKSPPFMIIAKKWPVEQLQEALAEGIMTGHPVMPEFSFDPEDIDDLLAYIQTLRKK